jgi:hypothetical protein
MVRRRLAVDFRKEQPAAMLVARKARQRLGEGSPDR